VVKLVVLDLTVAVLFLFFNCVVRRRMESEEDKEADMYDGAKIELSGGR
jgi:hypothetical protein